MENDRPKGDEEDALASKKSNFLETWQQRLGWFSELSYEKEESADERENKKDTKESKTTKRWQGLFGKVFSSIVKPSTIESKPLTEQSAPPTNSSETPEESTAEPVNNLASNPEMAADTSAEGSHPGEAGLAEEATSPSPEQSEETTTETGALSPELPDPPEAIAAINHQQNPESPLTERSAPIPATNTTKERVIERDGRGAGVAAGLFGLEFFARRRADRKLQHEIKKVSKDLKSQETKVQAKISQASPNTETIKPVPPPVERQSSPPLKAPELQIQDTRYTSKTATKTDYSPEIINSMYRDKESVAAPAREQLRPQEELKKSPQTAKEEIPVELYLERRHEIKDEAAQPHGAAPVGSILANMNSADTSVFTAAVRQIARQNARRTVSAPPSPTDIPATYKQAMKNGFWGAVTIIVFIGIALLLHNSQ